MGYGKNVLVLRIPTPCAPTSILVDTPQSKTNSSNHSHHWINSLVSESNSWMKPMIKLWSGEYQVDPSEDVTASNDKD